MSAPDLTPSSDDRLYNRKEAAAYLSEKLRGHVSVHSLAQLRTRGPRYRYFKGNRLNGGTGGGHGRWVVYTKADLDAWVESQLTYPTEDLKNGQNKLTSIERQASDHSSAA